MDGGVLLQSAHAPKPEHRPLPSSERQVRILHAIVQPASGLLPVGFTEIPQSRTEGPKLVRNEDVHPTVLLHGFLQEFQRSLLVPRPCDEALQHLALVIHRLPEVVPLPLIFMKTSSRCQRQSLDFMPSIRRFFDLGG